MRSIRRSLLGYLLVLLAVSLGAVGVLVERFANAAVRQREVSETRRIEQTFKVRQDEAKLKFDTDLMAETKALAEKVQWKTNTLLGQSPDSRRNPFTRLPDAPPVRAPEEESRNFRLRTELMLLGNTRFPMPTAVTIAAVEPRRAVPGFGPYTYPGATYPGSPGWVAYDASRSLARVHEAMEKAFEEELKTNLIQITMSTTITWGSIRNRVHIHSSEFATPLSVDGSWLEFSPQEREPQFSEVDVPGKGLYRRVTTSAHAGRPLVFAYWLPPPTLPASLPGQSYRPSWNRPDVVFRLAVQSLRPYSELEARLAADQAQRDTQLARVREETREELTQLRSRLILIGSATFVALVLGGWLIVARGLAPLHKLSDAVSQVSEKDFRLPVGAEELGRELAPIHARLTQTLTLLQRAFAREKQAVADISHELRTPIASLMATIDVALRKPRTPEQYRAALEECRLISKQLGQLVERIMTLASLDAGKDNTLAVRTVASELAGGCAAVIRPLAAANSIEVVVHQDEEITLETDPGKLREVLMNLLHNAVEYNKPNGTIELIVRAENSSAVFEVRDSGIGMTPDVKEKIFARFYRADSSRQSTGIHAGLGLAIVKEYVSRLNGTIEVDTEPDVGTTFRVKLPLAAPTNPPPAATLPPPVGTTDRAKKRDVVPTGS